MKIFTLFELQQFEAYPILKRILNDAEIQIFFNTPEAQRGTLIPTKRVVKVAPKPTATATINPPLQPNELRMTAPPKTIPIILGTQMCTKSEVYAMAMDYMGRNFEWQGVIYNMNKMGWKFEFSTKKNALGTCRFNRFRKVGTIFLSEWIIENSKETFDKWVNTILHEIAHAIDYMQNGSSSHDWNWKRIARSIGCDAERTTTLEFDDLRENPISKYTLLCPNGHTFPSHKKKVGHRETSCPKCANHFDSRYVLKQIKNW